MKSKSAVSFLNKEISIIIENLSFYKYKNQIDFDLVWKNVFNEAYKIERKKIKKIIKYLKNRPLPVFNDKNYNDGFKKGYKHAIELLKKE
jgi:hypothetical protein